MSIIYDSEADYRCAVNPILETLLGSKIGNAGDTVTADIVIGENALGLIGEVGLSIGSSDPSTQASISMRRYWIDHSVSSHSIPLTLSLTHFHRGGRYAKNAAARRSSSQPQVRGYVYWEASTPTKSSSSPLPTCNGEHYHLR